DVNNAGGSVLDDHNPPKWVTFACRFTALGYLAVFASSATFVLLQYATLRLPSAKVMAYTYLTPTWVVAWEYGLGRGTPPTILLGGVGLSVLALVLLLKAEG
ncbi:EamA family transporter, partial [Lacimonas salitolerans]